jgi:hypothetical protein
VLRGRLYADPSRGERCGPLNDGERAALQTLNRAVQGAHADGAAAAAGRLASFSDATAVELAPPTAAPAPHRLYRRSAPAITCDAFACAAPLAAAALAASFRESGFALLRERDVLSAAAMANAKLRPLLFDDAIVARRPPPKLGAKERARVGRRGFFTKAQPLNIDLRASNTVDLRDADRSAGLDPARRPP